MAGVQQEHPPCSGTDNGVRSLAARPLVNHLELSSRPGEMPFEPAKASIESLESSDPIRDVGPPLGDESRQLGGGVGAVAGMTPTRDLAGVPERDVEPAKLDQQPQMLNVRSCRSRGSRYPAARREGAIPSARRSGRCRSRHQPVVPVRRFSWRKQTLEWFECQGFATFRRASADLPPYEVAATTAGAFSTFSLRRRSSRSGPALPSAAITGPSNRQRPWG